MTETDERDQPYIKREAGDFITAQDWNKMQSEIRKTLNEHSHNGEDDKGCKLKGEAIDNTSTLTVAGLGVTGEMNVEGRTDLKGKLAVGGEIRAGNSDIYFTDTNHKYTQIGEEEGFAAIHNAQDYGALMIMGRHDGKMRNVEVWDTLHVRGKLEVSMGMDMPELTPELRVGGPIHADGDLSVKGLLSVEKDVSFKGSLTVENNITANKNFMVKDSLTVNNNVSIGAGDSPTMVDIVARTFHERVTDKAIALRLRNRYDTDGCKDSAVDFVISRFEKNGDNRPETQLNIRLSGNDNQSYDESIPNVDVLTLKSNGNAEVKGDLTIDGTLTPSAGNSENNGIMFPKDPGGGGGDAAWIRYYPRVGEATTFEIGTSNDTDDHIALMASGNVGIGRNNPIKPLHLKPKNRINPVVIENIHANTEDAKKLLGSLSYHSFLLGGPEDKFLYLYWKSEKGMFYATIEGKTL